MEHLLFLTDFSEASGSALKNIIPLAKQLDMKLKIVHFAEAEKTEVLSNQSSVRSRILGFIEKSLGHRPKNKPKIMGMRGSLHNIITETGRFFDMIVLSGSLDKTLLKKCLFEEDNFSPPCPILLLPETIKPRAWKKVIYIGAQFNELDAELSRQLRNICRRSGAELEIAKPLSQKNRWFYSKRQLNESKFLIERGWFRGLFFNNLRQHLQKEQIDIAVLSPQSLNASWLSKRMFVWRMGRLNMPLLILPRKIQTRRKAPHLQAA